jgi:hypothetical protein
VRNSWSSVVPPNAIWAGFRASPHFIVINGINGYPINATNFVMITVPLFNEFMKRQLPNLEKHKPRRRPH